MFWFPSVVSFDELSYQNKRTSSVLHLWCTFPYYFMPYLLFPPPFWSHFLFRSLEAWSRFGFGRIFSGFVTLQHHFCNRVDRDGLLLERKGNKRRSGNCLIWLNMSKAPRERERENETDKKGKNETNGKIIVLVNATQKRKISLLRRAREWEGTSTYSQSHMVWMIKMAWEPEEIF